MRETSDKEKVALIVVDNLVCFHKGGSLEVPGAEKINAVINDLHQKVDLTIAVQEWHPKDHCSFNTTILNEELVKTTATNPVNRVKPKYGPWPPHGIQNSSGPDGSAFHPDMDLDWAMIFRKGMKKDVDSYSAFYDLNKDSTGLTKLLKEFKITTVWITGLATEYCVKATVLDARKEKFKTVVWSNGVAGLEEEASQEALKEMHRLNAEIRIYYPSV